MTLEHIAPASKKAYRNHAVYSVTVVDASIPYHAPVLSLSLAITNAFIR